MNSSHHSPLHAEYGLSSPQIDETHSRIPDNITPIVLSSSETG